MSLSLDPDLFWRSTPRTVGVILDGARMRLEREQNERVTLAWLTVALDRTKRLPSLKSLVATGSARRQTWQDQLSVVKMINAAFGGR